MLIISINSIIIYYPLNRDRHSNSSGLAGMKYLRDAGRQTGCRVGLAWFYGYWHMWLWQWRCLYFKNRFLYQLYHSFLHQVSYVKPSFSVMNLTWLNFNYFRHVMLLLFYCVVGGRKFKVTKNQSLTVYFKFQIRHQDDTKTLSYHYRLQWMNYHDLNC